VHARPPRAAAKRSVPDQLRRPVAGVLCVCRTVIAGQGVAVVGALMVVLSISIVVVVMCGNMGILARVAYSHWNKCPQISFLRVPHVIPTAIVFKHSAGLGSHHATTELLLGTGPVQSFPSKPSLQGGDCQAQDADNNGDEESGKRQGKGVALGRLPVYPPLEFIPWRAFPYEALQDCQSLAPVSVFHHVSVGEHLVALCLCTVFVKALLGDQPFEDVTRPVVTKAKENGLNRMKCLG
jgi:hypothetical protein